LRRQLADSGRRFSAGFTRVVPPSPGLQAATGDDQHAGGEIGQADFVAEVELDCTGSGDQGEWMSAVTAKQLKATPASAARAAGGAAASRGFVVPPVILQLVVLLVGLVLLLVLLGTDGQAPGVEEQQQHVGPLLEGGARLAEL
jgi:hypothetical protein